MRVLFVGAHPDDIEQYAGGTAAFYAKMGAKLFFCVATNGNIGSTSGVFSLRPEFLPNPIRHRRALTGGRGTGRKTDFKGKQFGDHFHQKSESLTLNI